MQFVAITSGKNQPLKKELLVVEKMILVIEKMAFHEQKLQRLSMLRNPPPTITH